MSAVCIKGAVQQYAWGKPAAKSAVAKLFSKFAAVEQDKPYAGNFLRTWWL